MSALLIEHHGIIGNLRTIALVGVDGTVDWMCAPHFDSPSVFASLLDEARGGHFRIAAASPDARRRQMYLPESNVLMTRFLTPDGVGELVDFMPVPAASREGEEPAWRLVRVARGVRGEIPFKMECRPAFDYARAGHTLKKTGSRLRFSSASMSLDLASPLDLQESDGAATADFVLREGDQIPFVLGPSQDPASSGDEIAATSQQQFRETLQFWQSWISHNRYQGRWREMVKRSALALKLLTFAPTGAIVAAATTSLPERLRGDRNWDYRYTWIRDAAFTVYAFLRIGFTEEAEQFIDFLEDRCQIEKGLQVLYRIDGGREIPEIILDHLDGYAGSRPVRVGNAAAKQFQLDIAGDLMDAIYLYHKYCRPLSYRLWKIVVGIANWVCENWKKPDEGIWEVRGGAQQFTFSKMLCWVALDRALRLSIKESLPGDVGRWRSQRDEIYETIMDRGFSREKNSFVQRLDGKALDASMLLAPSVKFISASDPRMLGTLDAIGRELESDNLVRRYDPRVAPDGIGEEEGTFSMCTFWLAEALARAGRLEPARLIFEKMLGYGNHLGLFSEEIGLAGEALGNFPQGFTHMALISAAANIDRALDSRKAHGGRGLKPWQ